MQIASLNAALFFPPGLPSIVYLKNYTVIGHLDTLLYMHAKLFSTTSKFILNSPILGNLQNQSNLANKLASP